jgi:hypothetical protein
MDFAELHLINDSLLRGVDFERDDGVFAIVSPELIFPGFLIPGFSFVFPVNMVLAVHRGKEIQAFGEVGKNNMLG